MAELPIITVPDPVLREKAQPVERIDEGVKTMLENMRATMRAAKGIGLAANQVGHLQRLIICHVPDDWWTYGEEEGDGVVRVEGLRGQDENPAPPLLMVNPEIVWASEKKSVYEEGCLSIPQQYADVIRPAEVKVRYRDTAGQEQIVQAAGLLSHCVQHELDHLNGVLFFDYISKMKRDMMIKRVQKMKKQDGLL